MYLFLMLIAFVYAGNYSYMNQSHCGELIGTCEYYLCKNAEVSCDEENYFYEYGYRNCQTLTEPDFLEKLSPEGQNWLAMAKILLQEETENFVASISPYLSQKKQCNYIYKESFNIHSVCYYKAGFCDLSIKDRFHLLNKLKSEVFSLRSWKEFLQLRWGCLRGEPLSEQERELFSKLAEPPEWLIDSKD